MNEDESSLQLPQTPGFRSVHAPPNNPSPISDDYNNLKIPIEKSPDPSEIKIEPPETFLYVHDLPPFQLQNQTSVDSFFGNQSDTSLDLKNNVDISPRQKKKSQTQMGHIDKKAPQIDVKVESPAKSEVQEEFKEPSIQEIISEPHIVLPLQEES